MRSVQLIGRMQMKEKISVSGAELAESLIPIGLYGLAVPPAASVTPSTALAGTFWSWAQYSSVYLRVQCTA